MIGLCRVKEIVAFLETLSEDEISFLHSVRIKEYKRTKRTKYSRNQWDTARAMLQKGHDTKVVAEATGIKFSTLKRKIKGG